MDFWKYIRSWCEKGFPFIYIYVKKKKERKKESKGIYGDEFLENIIDEAQSRTHLSTHVQLKKNVRKQRIWMGWQWDETN